MAGQTHSYMEGLRKPRLMQWVLQQETPRKQVLLQIFGGTPECECARRMHMTLDEVRAIERWCADKGPTFVEDDYVMSYYATSSREEFCRATGQSEGVYRLMELRYPKGHRVTHEQKCERRRSEGATEPQTARVEPGPAAAEPKAAPVGPLNLPPRKAATGSRTEQLKRAVFCAGEERAKGLAEMMGAVCERYAEASVQPITISDFHWKEDARSIMQAVERSALMGCEYSTRYFYRKERGLMRRLHVRTPEELYEILRQIYVDADDGAVFGDHLSFGFGEIDRRKQVKRFVADRPGEPTNILAMEYEREYGFSAGTAEIWIDLFARPDGVSLSEWIERKAMGGKQAEKIAEPEPVVAEVSREAVSEPEPRGLFYGRLPQTRAHRGHLRREPRAGALLL